MDPSTALWDLVLALPVSALQMSEEHHVGICTGFHESVLIHNDHIHVLPEHTSTTVAESYLLVWKALRLLWPGATGTLKPFLNEDDLIGDRASLRDRSPGVEAGLGRGSSGL